MELTINHAGCSQAYRVELNSLMAETFGFTFEHWHRLGLWPADYVVYSLVDAGRVLSSAGVYRMDLLVNGVQKQYLQIGGVATRKDRQGEGLSRKILSVIFEQHSQELFFLCANDSVLNFYPKFGFRHVPDGRPWLKAQLKGGNPGMRKLAPEEALVGEYLRGRVGFSGILDCTNAAPVEWFHLLLAYSDCIYEIPALQAMLVAAPEGNTLNLMGVWAKQPVTFTELASHLDFAGVEKIVFWFNPDWLQVEYEMEEYPDSYVFVRGDWDIKGGYILPELIKT